MIDRQRSPSNKFIKNLPERLLPYKNRLGWGALHHAAHETKAFSWVLFWRTICPVFLKIGFDNSV